MRTNALKERQAPYAMLATGIAIVLAWELYRSRSVVNTIAVLGLMAIFIIAGVALMLLGCFITARLIGAKFGDLGPALLKLAAIFVFPSAIGWLLAPYSAPWATALATALYFALLLWLFDLEVYEAAIFSLVMIAIRWVGLLALNFVLKVALR